MSTKLWYNQYNEGRLNAPPLGNGKIAAMFFGDPQTEHIQVNEESLYTGHPLEEKYNTSAEMLDKIRQMIFDGDYEGACALSDEQFLANPPRVRFYQTIGDLYVDFADKGQVEDYHKELELSTGVAKANYIRGGVRYESETFISEKYNALAYRVCTPNGNKFSFDLKYQREDYHKQDRRQEETDILGQKLSIWNEQNSII